MGSIINSNYIEKANYIISDVLSHLPSKSKDYVTLSNYSNEEATSLFEKARLCRDGKYGNKLYVRASLEFSNFCLNNCSFCGMAKNNTNLVRYKVSVDEMKRSIDFINNLNIGQLHLVSGENGSAGIDDVCNVIKYATQNGINTTVVVGELTEYDYSRLYDSGARRYILKFETSNMDIYKRFKSGKSLVDRIAHLLLLRDMGFKIGTGVIIGLPFTTINDIQYDLNLISKIKPDMASASAFSPNEESELKSFKPGNSDLVLQFIATMRILLNDTTPTISCSSSLGFEWQSKALMAGANVVSYHITPEMYINDFISYRKKDRAKTCMEDINNLAVRANMEIGKYE